MREARAILASFEPCGRVPYDSSKGIRKIEVLGNGIHGILGPSSAAQQRFLFFDLGG